MEKTKKLTEKEIQKRLRATRNSLADMYKDWPQERVRPEGCPSVFHYAAWCERCMERNLREDYERQTTFTSDYSIAEWCGGYAAVVESFIRFVKGWKDDHRYMAELVIATNLKSWEHNARQHPYYSQLYAELYYAVKDLYFDLFAEDEEAINYYYDFVD